MERKKYERRYNANYRANTGYRLWLKTFKKTTGGYDVSQAVHGLVMKDFALAIINLMLFKNFEFRMPYRLGYLTVRKNKIVPKLDNDGKFIKSSMPIDFGACYKLWNEMYPGKTRQELSEIKDKPLVYYWNEHTDGYIMRIFWDKRVTKVKNSSIYSFKPVRNIQLYIGGVILNNPQLDFYKNN